VGLVALRDDVLMKKFSKGRKLSSEAIIYSDVCAVAME
jgi:hypothetical protein